MDLTADEVLNRYYETLKQCNARGRDNLFAELANVSFEESRRSQQDAQTTTDAVVVAGVRRSNSIAGLGFEKCSERGRMPWLSASTDLTSPASPDAGSR